MDIEPGYGWLGAAIPERARRFRVADPVLAAVLVDAGAQLVATEPDVEIAPVRELRGDATRSIAVLGRPPRSARPLPLRRVRTEPPLLFRAVRRLVHSLRVRVGARTARRVIRQLGYGTVWTFMWDHRMAPRSASGSDLRSRLIELLPQRALIVGERSRHAPTVLDEALAEAGRATASRLDAGSPLIRTELLIVHTDPGILRLAVGPGRRQILNQSRALSALHTGGRIPPLVDERVPRQLAGGRCGIAEWSFETRLPGARARAPVTGRLLADCVDFLAALHSAHALAYAGNTLMEQAEVVTDACSREMADSVRRLAECLEVALADLPRGFAHGDFFHGNLLVEDGRLVGVVDWDAAGSGRLPLLDLLHLSLTSASEMADDDWGPLLLRHLVPWARTGGGDVVRTYCQRAELDVDTARLQALVAAYWLDYVSYQLSTHPHQRNRPRWIERNVNVVSRLLAAGLV